MPVTKRAALGTGFGVITGLLVLSTALAYQIQESFSERTVAIHRHYVQEQEILTNLRRLLYIAEISARDYLLRPQPEIAPNFPQELNELRQRAELQLANLRNSSANQSALVELERHVRDLWKALAATASPGRDRFRDYDFVQQEIAWHRNAAGQVLQEFETANHSALTQSEEKFAASRSVAANKLLWLIAACLGIGVAVAWFSLHYSDYLERQAAARFEEVLAAKVELENLSKRLMEIQEEERTRLSRELHDEIVQNVAVLKIEITQALATLQNAPAREPLTRARDLADRTVRAVRNISLLLRPSLLDDLGLGPALQWLTEDFNRRTGVPCDYQEDRLEDSLPDAVKTCVYRVTQEALRNCEKHSEARHVTVCVQRTTAQLSVTIRDDGKGFQKAKRSPTSLGVLGMRERATSLGGDLKIDSSAGQGTTVRLNLPLAPVGEQMQTVEAHV